MSSLKKLVRSKLAGDAGVYLGGTLLNRIFPFLLIPVYTRTLSPREFGIYGFSLVLLNALMVLTEMGLNSATMRLYYDQDTPEKMRSFLLTGLVTRVVVAVAVSLVVGGIAYPAWAAFGGNGIPFWPIAPLTIVSAAVTSIIVFSLTVDRAAQRSKSFMRTNVVLTVLQSVAALVALFGFGLGAAAPITGYLAGSVIISLMIAVRMLRANWGAPIDLRGAVESLRYGAAATPTRIGSWVKNLSDRAVIGGSRSAAELGIYQLASSGIAPFYIFMTSFNQAYTPFYFEKRKAGPGSMRLIAAIDGAFVAAVAVLSLGAMCFCAELVRVLAPPSYADAGRLAPLLIAGTYLAGVTLQFTKELYYHKRPGLVSITSLVPAAGGLLLNLVFVPGYGAIAAALISLGVNLTTQVVTVAATQRVEATHHPMLRLNLVHAIVIAAALVLGFVTSANAFELASMAQRLALWLISSAVIVVLLGIPSFRKLKKHG